MLKMKLIQKTFCCLLGVVTICVIAYLCWSLTPQGAGWAGVFDRFIATLSTVATAAAVVVALWLSRETSRRQDRSASDLAKIAAAKIKPRLQRISFEATSMLGPFVGSRETALVFANLIELIGKGHLTGDDWDFGDEELLHLAPAPDHAALRIVRAVGVAKMLRKSIFQVREERIFKDMDRTARSEILGIWRRQVEDMKVDVGAAYRVVCELAEIGAAKR